MDYVRLRIAAIVDELNELMDELDAIDHSFNPRRYKIMQRRDALAAEREQLYFLLGKDQVITNDLE